MKFPQASRPNDGEGYLDGQLLLAMPAMTDPRFQRSVIYLCAHSEQGAMGLIINQHAPRLVFSNVLERLGIRNEPDMSDVVDEMLSRPVHVGGPVEAGRGFVLHTSDYFTVNSTLAVDGAICLTTTLDIVRAIAAGGGPSRCLLALGYSGWSPGQLEQEIQANSWLNCPADVDLLFDYDIANKYTRALAKLGVNPSFLVGDAGHA